MLCHPRLAFPLYIQLLCHAPVRGEAISIFFLGARFRQVWGKVCPMAVKRSRARLLLVVFAGSCFSVDGSAPLPISSADSLEAVRLPTSDGDGAMLPIRIPDVSTLQRTFLCVGPVCLRSGVGLMVGLGCGAGVGVGMGFPVTAQGGSFDSVGRSPLGQLLTQVPGGYTAIDLIRKVLARFPTSRIGAGCGIGW